MNRLGPFVLYAKTPSFERSITINMSFSKKVKDELSKQSSPARHCQMAELAALIVLGGEIKEVRLGTYILLFSTESLSVARKYFTLLKKTFNINTDISIKSNSKNRGKVYSLYTLEADVVTKILSALKLSNIEPINRVNHLLIQNGCCKRAFLRGAFLAVGSISDPQKTYHFELAVNSEEKALQLRNLMDDFGIDGKIIIRKKYYVVYVKEGSQIVDLLNIMEAHVNLMELENVRIIKEMRNSINRQVNCEAANITKTVNAASKQVEDILYIKETIGLDNVTEGLEDIAELRIAHPEASLKELGMMLNPPIGKSGVNHRLRKLSIIASSLREQKEEI